MRYYSTNHQCQAVSFKEALIRSEATDGGLYMPEKLPYIPNAFINNIPWMSLQEITYVIHNSFFGEDIGSSTLKRIGDEVASYPMPLYQIEPGIYVLELFHGPTKTVKDFGAQTMTRLLREVTTDTGSLINVLVPTTGHSGNAIAHALKDVAGVQVYVLHPVAKHSAHTHEELYSVTADNIHLIEVNGTIDDCVELTAKAFNDQELNASMILTSANSLNIGSLLPSTIPFFHAYAQLKKKDEKARRIYYSVPSGNCGNLLAGYMAKQMGLPAERLIGACNANGAMHRYLSSGENDRRRPSQHTYAYGMDMSFSANVPRFMELSHHDMETLRRSVSAEVCTDAQISDAINSVYERTGYLLDAHSATAYISLKRQMPKGASGVVMATAHPSLSASELHEINRGKLRLPYRLSQKTACRRPEVRIQAAYGALKKVLKFYNEANLAEQRFA